jgi:pyruvate dehydrogenase (quinone)
LGLRYTRDINLVGDSAASLAALQLLLIEKQDRSWRTTVEASVVSSHKQIRGMALAAAHPTNPQRVAFEHSSRLPDQCTVTADGSTISVWYTRDLSFRRGMLGSVSGTLATMECAMPYAIAAKFAYPSPVIALVGDGAMQMNSLAELAFP